MRQLGITLGCILLSGHAAAFGQSVATVATPFGTAVQYQTGTNAWSYFQSKSGPTAALQTGLEGTWWRDSHWVQTLDLTPDQQKKMDDAFRQNRLKLIDLTAALEKEELNLEPLVETVRPEDGAKILAQIDRVADARAELEKANARMLLAIRQVLTQDQWDKFAEVVVSFGD